jgi:hypothetical protein
VAALTSRIPPSLLLLLLLLMMMLTQTDEQTNKRQPGLLNSFPKQPRSSELLAQLQFHLSLFLSKPTSRSKSLSFSRNTHCRKTWPQKQPPPVQTLTTLFLPHIQLHDLNDRHTPTRTNKSIYIEINRKCFKKEATCSQIFWLHNRETPNSLLHTSSCRDKLKIGQEQKTTPEDESLLKMRRH